MKLISSKKANVADIVLSPTFTTMVGLGIVLLILLRAIYGLGSSVEFEKQFYATDLALLADSIQAIRPDVNFITTYALPAQYGALFEPRQAVVYTKTPEDGQKFLFSTDSAYQFVYGDFKPNRTNSALSFYKEGDKLGVKASGQTINLAAPYCEKKQHARKKATIDYQAFNAINNSPTIIIMGGIIVSAAAYTGEPTARIYVNKNPESADLACDIAKDLFAKIPELKGWAIVPLNAAMLSIDDARLPIAQATQPAAFVAVTVDKITPQSQGNIGQAIASGASNYVE